MGSIDIDRMQKIMPRAAWVALMDAIEAVQSARFGTVALVIERGNVKRIIPAPSLTVPGTSNYFPGFIPDENEQGNQPAQ